MSPYQKSLFAARHIGPFFGFALLSLISALIATNPLSAHGVAWRQAPSDKTYTIHFMYSDQTPMSYSEVKVFSPENDALEYQNSRTDANGWFAFVPNVSGEWSFETNDGQGHLSSGKIDVALEPIEPAAVSLEEPTAAPVAASQPSMASGGSAEPTVFRIGLGLSFIMNILFIGLLVNKKRKKI
ncbi:MAG: hypothetical protein LBJ64_03520 [Deltaproteobacteria bacterium]|jgi:hypothetical protein|nr:hypothetical protein [Deltaproteobacteria bacterium]